MALTVTKLGSAHKGMGGYWMREVHVVFDASYAANGEALTAATLGYNDNGTDLIVIQQAYGNSLADHVVVTYDGATEVLLAFGGSADGTAFDEITAAVDLSLIPVRLLVLGRFPTLTDTD